MVSNRSAWYGGSFVVVLFAVALTTVYGLDWVTDWVVWAMTAGTAGLIVFAMRGNYCAAGADWLRTHNGWVKTYELDEIKMHLHGNSVDLALRDNSGRRSSNKIADLQANQDLWDLTYNGIRHSAARGAEINNYARGALHLGGAKRER